MSFAQSDSSLRKQYITRVIDYKGERWRCTDLNSEYATLDFANDPDQPRRDDILTIPRKVFFECLLPRKKG